MTERMFAPLLHVSIPGEPVGKGRPRVTTVGGFARAYTPGKTARWETGAALQMRETWGKRPPLDEPVRVVVLAVASRPKRLLRKRDPDGRLWRTTKPDADNVAKAACDALVAAGVLRDDTLAVRLEVESLFARRDEGPSVEVWLEPAGDRVPCAGAGCFAAGQEAAA